MDCIITNLIMYYKNGIGNAVAAGHIIGEMICTAIEDIIPDIDYSLGWAEAGIDTICFWSNSHQVFTSDYENKVRFEELIIEVFPELEYNIDTPFGIYLDKDEAEQIKNKLCELKNMGKDESGTDFVDLNGETETTIMGRISFRALAPVLKGKDKGKLKWFYNILTDGSAVYIYAPNMGIQPLKDVKALCRSVNYWDKNDVEIYEGDILKTNIDYMPTYVVKSVEQFWVDRGLCEDFEFAELEVIGNIFESELNKQEEES